MPSRNLVYRVSIDTSQARRSATSIRQTIEAELRTIQIGKLNISSLTAATSEAQRFRHELEQAAQAAGRVQIRPGAIPPATSSVGSGTPAGLVGGLVGGFAAGAIVGEIQQVGDALVELSRRGAVFGQISDVLNDYAASVGTNADALISAAKKASMGTISEYELILNANRAVQFELAKTPEQFAKLIELSTALGRAQGISDEQALDYLTRGIARQSSLILDNLGIFIDLDETLGKYASSLGKTSDELTKAERNQALLNESFAQGQTAIQANRDASESAATQIERLDANVQDLKDSFGRWLAEASADKIGAVADAMERVNAALEGKGELPPWLIDFGKNIEEWGAGMGGSTVPTAAMSDILQILGRSIQATDESTRNSIITFDARTEAINEMRAATEAAAAQEQALRQAESGRSESIGKQQDSVNKALSSAATKSVPDIGLENALNLLKQQKAAVDAAIQELIASSITDPDELSLRIAEIQQMAVQAFSDMAAMMPEVDPSVTAGSFETINQAMQALNQGFVDFLPSASAVRDELASLAEEVMFTGVVTDEQAAALQNYASVAAAIADETSLLSAVTDELGISFLYANPEASGLIDAMYQAQASYLSGSITAEAYAGMISVLGQQLLILAQQAGVATGSILALVQAQAGLAGKGGFQVGAARGNAVAARISAQQDARDRQRAIREAEQAAKRSAQEQQRSAKKAGKELEDGAKKASRELKSALSKVEGLFGRSAVTEKDMLLSKGGVYQDKADEYLRRLQAEVEQNKDLFGDVDIETAKQSLRDLGVQVADDQKIAFEQFADAWESGLLFFDPANVDKYIDKAAVERELELQKKAEEGKNNIYKAFGVVIDEAVDAVTGGAGGGGGGGISVGDMDFTPQVAAAIDNSPLFNGEPYLLNLDPVVDQNAIWSQLEMPAGGGSKGWNIPVQPVMYGPQPKSGAGFPAFNPTAMGLADLSQQAGGKVEVTATLAPDAGSTLASDLADQLAKQVDTFKSQGGTIGDILLAGISESFNVIQGDQVVDTGVADGIIASIGAQLGAKMEVLKNVGKGAGEIVKSGLAENISSTQWVDGEMVAPIATGMVTAINTQIRSQSEAFKREGTTAGQLVMAGVSGGFGGTAGMNGEPSTDLAMAMVKALNTQFTTAQNFFYATGQPAAFSVMDGYKGSFVASGEGTPLVTPMITAINTQIRASSESLRAQGTTMAQYVQHGFTTAFNGESFKSAIIAAGETMGAYLEIGILSRISGGALVEAIGAQIMADMSAEVEAP